MYIGGLFIFGCFFRRTILHPYIIYTSSGKHTKNHGKSPFLMGKSTISMAIFNMIIYPIMGILGILAMRQKDPCYSQKNGLMLKSPLKMVKQSSYIQLSIVVGEKHQPFPFISHSSPVFMFESLQLWPFTSYKY